MKLLYTSLLDEGRLILTNFNCGPSQQLLSDKGLYKILWTTDAPRVLTIDGYKKTLQQHQVVFCTPLNVLEVEQGTGLLALVFNREFYCIQEHDAEVSCHGLLFYGTSEVPVITLDEKEVKRFEALFIMLEEEFETRDHIQGEMLRVLLKRLLIKSSRLIKSQFPQSEIPKEQVDILRNFHILVEQHFREKHKVADYASLLFKSPKTLSNLFKKSGDKTPLQIIHERIILESKRLLQFSDKNVQEISYEIGYSDPSHFSKMFKKQVGISPIAFKNLKSPQ